MTLYTLSNKLPVKVADGIDQVPLMIVNRDLTNQVVYGDQTIANLNQNTLAVIDPLGSVSLDGTDDIWLLAVSGAPTVDVVPGGTNWSPSPAAIAAQINALGLATSANQASQITQGGTVITNTGTTATNVAGLTVGGSPGGVPMLRGTDNLGNGTAQSLAAGATVTLLNSIAITKASFEGVFKLNLPSAAGTIPFVELSILWQDSNTGLQVGQKLYVLTAGNGPTAALFSYISGPCRGNQITLTMRNFDPAQILTYTWAFNQTAHVYLTDKLLQPIYSGVAAPITYINPAGDPRKGLLAQSSAVIAATATQTRLCAASNSKIDILVDNNGQANAVSFQLATPSSLAAVYNEQAFPVSVYRANVAAGNTSLVEWQMPNGPVVVNVTNTGASGNVTPSWAILLKDT